MNVGTYVVRIRLIDFYSSGGGESLGYCPEADKAVLVKRRI